MRRWNQVETEEEHLIRKWEEKGKRNKIVAVTVLQIDLPESSQKEKVTKCYFAFSAIPRRVQLETKKFF